MPILISLNDAKCGDANVTSHPSSLAFPIVNPRSVTAFHRTRTLVSAHVAVVRLRSSRITRSRAHSSNRALTRARFTYTNATSAHVAHTTRPNARIARRNATLDSVFPPPNVTDDANVIRCGLMTS